MRDLLLREMKEVDKIEIRNGIVTKTPDAGAVRADTDKPRMDLLSSIAAEGTAMVLAFGAKKYAANNWRKGMAWGRVIGSLLRHTFALMKGEDIDKESGLPHVDHIGCNAMFLQEYYRTHKNLDDRHPTKAD